MWFTVSNIDTKKYFLLFETQLIARKIFNCSRWGKIKLISLVMRSLYEFEIVDDLLISKPNNNSQEVALYYNVIDPYGESRMSNYRFFDNLGYHIDLFDGRIEQCLKTFKLYGGSLVNLPVIIKQNDIQLIGDGAIVEKFGIPSPDLYKRICEYYKVEPLEELVFFLSELFKSYSD
jgi:hypothetical protein